MDKLTLHDNLPKIRQVMDSVATIDSPESVLNKLNDPELTKLLAEGQNIDRKLPLNQQFRETGTVNESYFGPTVAAITGDPFLIALESTLAKESPNFRREAAASYKKGITGLNNLVKLMEQSGDPLLVSKAAKMKAKIYRTMIERKLLTAQENAEATVNKVIGPEKQSKLDEIISKSDLGSTDPHSHQWPQAGYYKLKQVL